VIVDVRQPTGWRGQQLKQQEEKVKVNILEGKTLTKITVSDAEDEIYFECADGSKFKMLHHQNCCESVRIEDVCGDLQDLVGTPILLAEEVTNKDHPFTGPHGEVLLKAKFLQGSKPPHTSEYGEESETWTFYKFRTIKGSVDIRWHGTSNGYYSESVDFQSDD